MKTNTTTKTTLSALASILLGVGSAAAQVADIEPSKDNTLYQSGAGNLSNGAGEFLFAGATDDPTLRRGLIHFDVAGALPPGVTIDSVSLTLTMSRTIAGAEPIALHRATSDWGEGLSDAPGREGGGTAPTIGDATWLHTFFDTMLWTNPGGDFTAVSSAIIPVAGNGPYTWGPSAGMIADVQSWLDTPATNFGWVIVGNETGSPTAKRFNSRENADAASRPVLHIEYSAGPVGSTVYESIDETSIVQPANAVGTATGSPYDHSPAADPLLFYQVDDGAGNPPLIRLTRGGLGVLIHF